MNIIVCVDDDLGMLFGGRRQSRDKAVTEDILRTVGEGKLYISPFSSPLFGESSEKVVISESFLDDARTDDFCFIEDADVGGIKSKIGKVIIYKWNRRYPADKCFCVELLGGKSPLSIYNFKGNSHDKITKEVYEL